MGTKELRELKIKIPCAFSSGLLVGTHQEVERAPWKGITSRTNKMWLEEDTEREWVQTRGKQEPWSCVLRVPRAAWWPRAGVRGQQNRSRASGRQAENPKRRGECAWSFAKIWLWQQLSYFNSRIMSRIIQVLSNNINFLFPATQDIVAFLFSLKVFQLVYLTHR